MFFGELTCLPAYGVKKLIEKSKQQKAENPDLLLSPGGQIAQKKALPTNINPMLIAIPASCDFLGSSLMFCALTMTPASVYQMMRGIIVVITCLMSVAFLGKKQYRHHWTGVIMIVFGVAWVGVVALAAGYDNDSASGSMVVGIILLLISQCFAGTQFISEEILLGGYYLDPFKVVGTEGMFGLLYYLIALPGL
jgi:drug/metabolite transporter (DMT)-like permease